MRNRRDRLLYQKSTSSRAAGSAPLPTFLSPRNSEFGSLIASCNMVAVHYIFASHGDNSDSDTTRQKWARAPKEKTTK